MTGQGSLHDSLATCWITLEILDSLENKTIRESNDMAWGHGCISPLVLARNCSTLRGILAGLMLHDFA